MLNHNSALFWEGKEDQEVVSENTEPSLTLAGGVQSRVLVGLVDVDEGEVISVRM